MIGERIHSYEINAHLGEGGMGNVFRATDNMLGREVALKMLHPQLTLQPQFLERFKKEARILAQLLHPNIAVIYNFIEQGGHHFMVMEYVEGTSLDDLLKKYRVLPAEFVVPVFIQALEGLQHAHRKNIFHRDIKPANLMITNEAVLKLMDFGIAKVAGEQKMTQVNKIVGTLEFMAPELIEGKDASAASDIYSMGATLYELISGKIPFEGDTDFNLMQAILKSKIKPPEKFYPLVPRALSEIVLKAMDKNPEQRYPNARAFQQALITAFPHYREIDINVLRKAQETVFAAKSTGETLQPTRVLEDSSSLETRVELAKPLAAFQLYKQKILSNKLLANKKLSLMILGLLLLGISIFAVIAIRGAKTTETVVSQNDSLKQVVQNTPPVSKTDDPSLPSTDNIQLPQTDKRIAVMDEIVNEKNAIPVQEENKIPVRGEKPKRGTKNEIKDPLQKPVENNEKEERPAVKEPEKKEIYINSQVMVNLALTGTPDMNQEKKQAQRVSFSVTRPVYYDGVLIIRQGAKASGSLTIGRNRTDIEIEQVEGANGMRIPLKAERDHGKRKDIESNQTFNAIIQQGTRMSF
ncbi:MAG: serine/threonine-protein kinase [Ferruginibacter sp.]